MLKRFLILILCSLLLSGCGNKLEKEAITFASWGSITEVAVINKLISDFEKENPDLKINFLHVPQNYFQKLHLLFASNTAPDVVFINNLYLPMYASYLEDLTEYVDKKSFYSQAIEGLSYDGKLLAIPRDISNLVFYVNTDLVDVKRNWNLDDLLKIAQSKGNVWGIGIEEDIYWALPYLAYFGEVFDTNFIASNSKGFVFYKNLRDKYKVAPTKSDIGSSTLAQMFIDKKIALYLSGRWMYPKISEKADFDWEVALFPVGKGEAPCDMSGWALTKSSKHKEAALRFLKYISSEKCLNYFTETGLIVPAHIKVSKALDRAEHNEKVFLEAVKGSKNTFVFNGYKKIIDDFNSKNF